MMNTRFILSIRTLLILVTLDILFSKCDAQTLTITPAGSQIKTIDSGMIFTCSYAADDSSVPGLRWYRPEHRLVEATSGRVYTEYSDGKRSLRLFIRKVEESDAGLYTCVADLGNGRQLVEETRMFLYENINFVDTPIYQSSLLGSSPLLKCIAYGQPSPKITWRFNRRRILADDDKYSIEAEGLRIKDLDLRDNGTYECRAEVESHGNVKLRQVTVDVLYPPVILRAPTADMVVQGQNKTLQCRATGNPPVKYTWFREQKMTEMIRVKVKLAEDTEEYDLGEVEAEDEGRYFCRVSNEYATKEVYVDVKMLVPPVMSTLPERVVINEGENLNLSCEAAGVPFPKIVWTKHSSGDSANYTKEHLRITGSWIENEQPGINTLMIRNVRRNYAGILSCSADNPVGFQVRQLALVVQYPPMVKIEAPEQVGWARQTRDFRCIAHGIPVPTIVWYRGDQYVSNDRIYSISIERYNDSVQSVLSIRISEKKPWIYSGYSCMAKNPHGHATERARLEEAFAPDTPRDFTVEEETPTSVTLKATAPSRNGGMPIISWLLKYDEVGNRGQSQTVDFPAGVPLIVRNLQPDTSYNFQLSLSNAVGQSHPLKFRVTTPRQSITKEQLDYPGQMEDHLLSDRRDQNQIRHPTAVESGVKLDDGIFSGFNVTLLGVVAGAAVVLLAIIIAVVCGVTWRIKRKRGFVITNRQTKIMDEPVESCTIPLQTRRPNDPLPDVTALSNEPEIVEVTYYGSIGRRDMIIRSPQLQRSGTSSFSPVPQHREWNHEIKTRENLRQGSQATATFPIRHTPATPPTYLLDAAAAGTVPRTVQGRVTKVSNPRGTGMFMEDILDGYISGENVDDDIDKVDFTIRLPSIHGKMCDI